MEEQWEYFPCYSFSSWKWPSLGNPHWLFFSISIHGVLGRTVGSKIWVQRWSFDWRQKKYIRKSETQLNQFWKRSKSFKHIKLGSFYAGNLAVEKVDTCLFKILFACPGYSNENIFFYLHTSYKNNYRFFQVAYLE